jgi:hypothetical protein
MSESESGKPGSVDAQPPEGSTRTEAAPEAKPAEAAAEAEPSPGEPSPASPPVKEEDDEDDGDGDGDGADGEDEADGPLDLESRILCPDGSCIGVIGPDGRCKECGAVLPEKERAATAAALATTTPAKQEQEREQQPSPSPSGDASDDPLDFSKRMLCSDGSCIGVIGPDGRCKECGKPYRGEPTD